AEYPQAKWHQYDPVSRDGARMAAGGTGAPAEPIYHFDKADVIVALDADVLTCGPGTVRYQKDFAGRRRVTDDKKEMSRLYAIESTPTLTGVKADHRLALKAGDIEAFGRQLAGRGRAPAPSGAASAAPDPGSDVAKWAVAIAKDLQAHRGRSLV